MPRAVSLINSLDAGRRSRGQLRGGGTAHLTFHLDVQNMPAPSPPDLGISCLHTPPPKKKSMDIHHLVIKCDSLCGLGNSAYIQHCTHRGGSSIFLKGVHLRSRSTSKKGGGGGPGGGSNFGPNVKKPTSWAPKGGGSGPHGPSPWIRPCAPD